LDIAREEVEKLKTTRLKYNAIINEKGTLLRARKAWGQQVSQWHCVLLPRGKRSLLWAITLPSSLCTIVTDETIVLKSSIYSVCAELAIDAFSSNPTLTVRSEYAFTPTMSTTLDFMHEIESQESLGNHNVKPVFFPSNIDVGSDSYSEIVLCKSHPVSDGQAIPMSISKASPVTRREIKTEPSWKV
jgi:hypothetical protein